MNIFTLAIGDYFYGFAALCNSLCAVGFDGQIHVGYQGEIRCQVAAIAPIVFHELPDDSLQPMNRKPAFLLDHAAGAFLFLDADIVVMNRGILDALSDAVSTGPVFCAEGIVPEHAIRRAMWRRAKMDSLEDSSNFAASTVPRSSTYFNSGLVCGHMDRDRRWLSDWNRIIRRMLPADGDGLFEVPYFPMPDQDCLNALLQDEIWNFSASARRTCGMRLRPPARSAMSAASKRQSCMVPVRNHGSTNPYRREVRISTNPRGIGS